MRLTALRYIYLSRLQMTLDSALHIFLKARVLILAVCTPFGAFRFRVVKRAELEVVVGH